LRDDETHRRVGNVRNGHLAAALPLWRLTVSVCPHQESSADDIIELAALLLTGQGAVMDTRMELKQKRRRKWANLHAYIYNNHGWVVSKPDETPIRFLCLQDSDLPETLKGMGFQVSPAGTTERIGMSTAEPMSEHGKTKRKEIQQVGIGTVAIYEFDFIT
jgi:hypothetical protein